MARGVCHTVSHGAAIGKLGIEKPSSKVVRSCRRHSVFLMVSKTEEVLLTPHRMAELTLSRSPG